MSTFLSSQRAGGNPKYAHGFHAEKVDWDSLRPTRQIKRLAARREFKRQEAQFLAEYDAAARHRFVDRCHRSGYRPAEPADYRTT